MTESKQIRGRRRLGNIVKIDLGDGYWAYGRVLESPLVAFYDLKASNDMPLQTIVSSPVAFKINVIKYPISKGIWPVIGNLPLTPDLEVCPRFFSCDAISGAFSIFTESGDEIPATLEECVNLECLAVWDLEHVIDRLNDHFVDRPNGYVESLSPASRLHQVLRFRSKYPSPY